MGKRANWNNCFTILSCFLFSGSLLFAQEAAQTNDKTVYVIRSVEYRITGKTKETALEREGEFKKGERFTGREALETYRAEKLQTLYNIRALDGEKCSVEYRLGEAEEDGAIPVYLELAVTDSSNLVILPEPKYDSNSGFTLSLKAREYNFLGTLSPLKIDLVWGSDDKDRTSAGFLVDFALPFSAAGFDWAFTAFNEFKYYLEGEPVYNKTAFGIAVELPVSFTAFTFGFEQGIVIHEDNTARIARTSVYDQYHDWYMYSKLSADWKIPTPLQAGTFGRVVYTPGVYGVINYQPSGDVGDYRRGVRTGFNQTIGFGRINWTGNFRQGLKVSLFTGSEYNFFRRDWINSAGVQAEGHMQVSKIFGISGRLLYTKWWNDYYDNAGDVIRGYNDNELDAAQRLSLNLEFPFRLTRFVPSEWSGNRKFRYFDFEQHWSPFIDLVMLDAVDENFTFNPDSIIPGAGLEIITFPLTWRSFYIRASAGWNLKELMRTGKLPSGIHREIYMGLGHYY
jgi:hypothetical protein